MNKNYNYFINTDMKDYVGKWVAIDKNKIIVSGDHIKEVIIEAKKKISGTPFITKVPEKVAMIF